MNILSKYMPLDYVAIQLERYITKFSWQGASPLDSSLEVDSSLKPMSFDRITVRSLSMTICKPSPSSPLSRSSFPAWHQKLLSPLSTAIFFSPPLSSPTPTADPDLTVAGWGWDDTILAFPKRKFLKKKHPPHVLPPRADMLEASGSYRRQRCQGIMSGSGK